MNMTTSATEWVNIEGPGPGELLRINVKKRFDQWTQFKIRNAESHENLLQKWHSFELFSNLDSVYDLIKCGSQTPCYDTDDQDSDSDILGPNKRLCLLSEDIFQSRSRRELIWMIWERWTWSKNNIRDKDKELWARHCEGPLSTIVSV